MKDAGVKALTPKRNTSRPRKQHRRFRYLLRNARIVRINQIWAADITYIRLARGSLYLVAIMDLYSRRVLAWQLSNTLDNFFCVGAGSRKHQNQHEEAATGSLDNAVIERLWRSIKHEEVFLRAYENASQARWHRQPVFRPLGCRFIIPQPLRQTQNH